MMNYLPDLGSQYPPPCRDSSSPCPYRRFARLQEVSYSYYLCKKTGMDSKNSDEAIQVVMAVVLWFESGGCCGPGKMNASELQYDELMKLTVVEMTSAYCLLCLGGVASCPSRYDNLS